MAEECRIDVHSNIKDDKDNELLVKLIVKKEHSEEDYNKIGWVPMVMQRDGHFHDYFDEYCQPKELKIGPIHGAYYFYGHAAIAQEILKVKLAGKFVESFMEDKNGERLLNKIKNKMQDLQTCFVKWVAEKYETDFLARLLFLDGCAILQFIHSYLRNELQEFGINNHQASRIREDLFLLRNQIPFRVLKLSLKLTNNSDQLKNDIVNFLHMNNIMMAPVDDLRGLKQWNDDLREHKQWTDILRRNTDRNAHLLELLHSLIMSTDDDNVDTGNNRKKDDNIGHLPSYSNQQKDNCCLPRFSFLGKKSPTLEKDLSQITRYPNYKNNKRFFRNAQELKSAGIEFKQSSSLATVSFNSKCFNIKGTLKLPPITVDEWTESKLMNLVAYEMCFDRGHHDHKNWYVVTSYVKLMDFLVDREQDVKELRGSRILWNRLSSDELVAKLFNNIGSKCFEPPQDKDIYSNVKTEIQTHCERKCAIWMAQVCQEHLSSPWTIVALFAAAIVLILTVVQTWYTVNPQD